MSESSELSHARQDVEAAFRVLEFAIRTMCYFELGKVDMSIFSQPLTLLLKEKNAGFRDSHFSSLDHAIIASQMNVGAAFGVSAIVLDIFLKSREESGIHYQMNLKT